jgi:hypothetical protein
VASCLTLLLMRARLLLGSVGGADLCSRVGILLRKTFDPACGIDQLLFAGEERVAVRANFDAQHVAFDSRARGKSVAAGAVYGYLMIVGVNTGFHGAPVCRVRSARLPGWDTTAASLGRETIVNYTQKRKDLQTGARCPPRRTLSSPSSEERFLPGYRDAKCQRVADSTKFAACSSWPKATWGSTRNMQPPEASSSGRISPPYLRS